MYIIEAATLSADVAWERPKQPREILIYLTYLLHLQQMYEQLFGIPKLVALLAVYFSPHDLLDCVQANRLGNTALYPSPLAYHRRLDTIMGIYPPRVHTAPRGYSTWIS